MNIIYTLLIVLSSVLVVLLIRKYTSVEFVSHAKLLFKAWSVWLSSVGALLGVYLLQAPDALLGAWHMLPDELKTMLPVNFSQYVSYALIGLGVISQFIRQRKLVEQKQQMEVKDGINH